MNVARMLVIVGFIVVLGGHWAMISEALRRNKTWALLLFFCGLAAVPFFAHKYWLAARIPLFIELAGAALMIAGFIVGTE